MGSPLDLLDHRCDVTRIEHARGFAPPNLGISDEQQRGANFKTRYENDKRMIEEGRAHGRSTILPDGVERITKGYWLEYVLPQSLAPTADGTPVALNCLMSSLDPREVGLPMIAALYTATNQTLFLAIASCETTIMATATFKPIATSGS